MTKHRLDPAYRIITSLGGHDVVEAELGVSKSRLYRWHSPKDTRGDGTGGQVPQRWHVPLLDLARRRNVPLTPGDFLPVAAAAAKPAALPERATA